MLNLYNYYYLVTVLPREFLVLAPQTSIDVLFKQLSRNAVIIGDAGELHSVVEFTNV